MKKIIAIVAALTLTSAAVSAQAFKVGDMKANLGYSVIGGADINSGNGLTHIRPITLSADYALLGLGHNLNLGVGVFVSGEYYKILNNSATAFVTALRPALNYSLLSNINLYAGCLLGYDFAFGSNGNSRNGEFQWAPYVGADLFLIGGLGVYGEFGYGSISQHVYGTGLNAHAGDYIFLNVGVTLKF